MTVRKDYFSGDELNVWRGDLAQSVFRVALFVGALAVVGGIYAVYGRPGSNWKIVVYVLTYLCILVGAFVPWLPTNVRSGLLLGVLYILGVVELIDWGLGGTGLLFVLTLPPMAGILFGRRGGNGALLVTMLTVSVCAWLFSTGRLIIPPEKHNPSADPMQWISDLPAFMVLGMLLLHSQAYLLSRLGSALTRGREVNEERERILIVERDARERLHVKAQEYVAHMAKVAQGDLASRLPLADDSEEQDDPLIVLGRRLNEMTASLQETIDQERAQSQVIEMQQQAIHQLSTPIIPVMDVPDGGGGIVVMPLIGSIDTMRARDITRTLLAGIRKYNAKVVILDITGVAVVDSGVANHLNKTIQAARLKGARVIVTGISDAVAETIVDLGIDWSRIETLSDLQMGLIVALEGLGFKLESFRQ